MKRALFIAMTLLFTTSNLFAKSEVLQNSEIEKYSKIWKEFLSQYDSVLKNYEVSSPKAQELEKKVQLSYARMREAYALQYSRCSKMYNRYMDGGVKEGSPMVKDLEREIKILKLVGGKMKKTMTIDQQKELLQWLDDKNLPQILNYRPGERLVKEFKGVEFVFRYCPAGSFTMGSPQTESSRQKDETQHQVTLTKGFWIMETEVTQKQWQAVMGNNPSNFKGVDLPVENVSWKDCQEFCRRTKFQLPTEAQWEYACRAGSTERFAGNLEEMAWAYFNSDRQTHPVGTLSPNAWNLYDMHGNVLEWGADWYDEYPVESVTDPKGPSNGSNRVCRGGSYMNTPLDCRSATRGSSMPGRSNSLHGFRCVIPVNE